MKIFDRKDSQIWSIINKSKTAKIKICTQRTLHKQYSFFKIKHKILVLCTVQLGYEKEEKNAKAHQTKQNVWLTENINGRLFSTKSNNDK